jgi:hypothetical protein
MEEDEHLKLLDQLDAAHTAANTHVSQLAELALSESLGQQWSSQVTRCQSQVSDAVKNYKYLLFELEILLEEEDRCA